MNNGSDHVFLCSTKMAKVSVEIDVNGEPNYLQEEPAYFDRTVNRVWGFVSFALWIYHSTLRKVPRLANMEIRSEKNKGCVNPLYICNERLEKVTGKKGYKFNCRCFVCDKEGANFTGMKEVYGEEFVKDRVCGCQWHFKNDVQNKTARISDPALKQKFIDICNKLCEVTTVSKYNILKSMLDEMAKLYPDLKPWIAWFHSRHSHIFAPFRIEGLPKVNFSEIGSAG